MKDKEIEEIARTIIYCPFSDADSQAKAIYDLGYRKIYKDSVVLTKEELEQMVNVKMKCINDMAIITRKETAEKFESELKAFIKVWKMSEDDAMSIPFYKALFEKIGKLAKQFGVEIKEKEND